MRSPPADVLPSQGAQPAGFLPVTQDSQAEQGRVGTGAVRPGWAQTPSVHGAGAATTSALFTPCWQIQASERLTDLVHSFLICGSDSLLPHQRTSLPGKSFPTHRTDKSFCICEKVHTLCEFTSGTEILSQVKEFRRPVFPCGLFLEG